MNSGARLDRPGSPPVARRDPQVITLHGEPRQDDYAWLGDPDEPEVRRYLEAEQAHYTGATAHLEAVRERLHRELRSHQPEADASVGWRRHEKIYFTRILPGEENDRLYRLDALTGVEETVLDPTTVDPGPDGDRSRLRIGWYEVSPDGALVAYAVDPRGTGRFELRFRRIADAADLPDRLPVRVEGGGAWTSDASAFCHVTDDARGATVRRHRLGAPPAAGAVLRVEPDPRFTVRVRRSRDDGWIVVTAETADTSEVHLLDADAAGPLALVAPRTPGVRYDVEPLPGGWPGDAADLLLIVTDDGAPEFHLRQAPVPAPGDTGDRRAWEPVPGLPGRPGERLEFAAALDRHVLLGLRRDGEPFLRVVDRPPAGHDLTTVAAPPDRAPTREIHPGVPCGQVWLWKLEDPAAAHVVIVEENLVSAPAWVEVDLATGARSVVKRAAVPGVDPSDYVTDRLWAAAPDGARVPITLARRRTTRPGHTAGLVVTGHGAHEVCTWPAFSVSTLALLDRDLVFALVHPRGGGELGRGWWEAARGRGKPLTFVDYVAARDVLVAGGWAGDVRGGARVVTRGSGAGGLLQGAVYSRAPRMWRAVIAESPPADVVTATTSPTGPTSPTGRTWPAADGEWGDPRHDPADLRSLLSWSPYDNPPGAGRPALLVTAGLRDGRVHEAAKWVARLRATQENADPQGAAPLLRVDLAETSGRPRGRAAGLAYEAEVLAWLLDQLGLA